MDEIQNESWSNNMTETQEITPITNCLSHKCNTVIPIDEKTVKLHRSDAWFGSHFYVVCPKCKARRQVREGKIPLTVIRKVKENA